MRHDSKPFDLDELSAITDPSEWLVAFVNQAIARDAIDAQLVIDLQTASEHFDLAALARVRQAFEQGCPAEGLAEPELTLFLHLLGARFRVPSVEAQAFYAAMRQQGGCVGYDNQDRLVWGLPGGSADVVLDADGKAVSTAH